MTPLEITDADRKAADNYSGLDTMKMGDPAERIARAISYGFIKGAKYGKTQGALEVIKMLESDEAREEQSKSLQWANNIPTRTEWASWLREKINPNVAMKTIEHGGDYE